jgi:hypothetical protein
MIHAQQVQQAMQHENPDLLQGAVAEGPSLGAGAWKGDGDVSKKGARGGERQHVGGVIVAQKLKVQAAQFGIARDQAVEGAAMGHFHLEAAGESLDEPAAEIRRDAPERNGTALG